jgi:hypothetical protein
MKRSGKAEQEKRRREHTIAKATGLRVIAVVSGAVPVRLPEMRSLLCAGANNWRLG